MGYSDDLLKLLVPELSGNAPEIRIYGPENSPRFDYTCKFIFGQVLQVRYFIGTGGTNKTWHLNYSDEDISGAIKIPVAGLLTETGIKDEKPDAKRVGQQTYFYHNGTQAGLPFDFFSAVFYFISRYEEWQNFEPDAHGRFEAPASLLYKEGLHLSPVVDQWIVELKKMLKEKFPELEFPPLRVKTLSTIDVDNLYAYNSKGFLRTAGASMKDLMKLDFVNLYSRFRVIAGKKKDPFDIYNEVSAYCREQGIPVLFFFLYGGNTKYDRSLPPSEKIFGKIFGELFERKACLGLHPSYNTVSDKAMFDKELRELRKHSGVNIRFSRQHYLRFDIRKTPRWLMEHGIKADFTMGFASSPGFRAGTAYPFNYFDFAREQSSPLLFVPFSAMDGAYSVYKKCPPEEALNSMEKLAAQVQKSGGFFITVFHERSFHDRLYPGFGTLYKTLHNRLGQSVEKGN